MKLSYSAVQKYNRCPRSYDLHYNERIREEGTSSALLFGSAIDKALNALIEKSADPEQVFIDAFTNAEVNGIIEELVYSSKITYFNGDFDDSVLSDDDRKYILSVLDTDIDMLGLSVADWHERLVQFKREKEFGVVEKHIFNLISWFSLLNKGKEIIKAYKEQVFPKIKRVIAIQKYFSLKNEENDELIGFIDMICEWEDGRIVIFDHKTSSAAYDENKAVLESEQLATYDMAVGDELKDAYVGFIVFVKAFRKKKLPKVRVQVLIDKCSDALKDKVLDNYDEAIYNIKQKKFEKDYNGCKDEKGFLCPYYGLCHKNSMAGLIKLEVKTDDKK